jgi:hypothetical protein
MALWDGPGVVADDATTPRAEAAAAVTQYFAEAMPDARMSRLSRASGGVG